LGGHEKVVDVLLNRGADPGAVAGAKKFTPLQLAEQKGHQNVVDMFRKTALWMTMHAQT